MCRRYHIQGSHEPAHPIGLRLVALILTSIAFSTSFTQKAPIAVPFVFLGLWWVASGKGLDSQANINIPQDVGDAGMCDNRNCGTPTPHEKAGMVMLNTHRKQSVLADCAVVHCH
jgi:hypothetical protein